MFLVESIKVRQGSNRVFARDVFCISNWIFPCMNIFYLKKALQKDGEIHSLHNYLIFNKGMLHFCLAASVERAGYDVSGFDF